MNAMGRLACVAAMVLLGSVAWAGGWRALDLDERLDGAHDALVGTVSAVNVDVRDGEPWTVVTLDVERWFLRDGQVVVPDVNDAVAPFDVAFWGGRAPGAPTVLVAGLPTFTVGDHVILLLHESDVGLATPIVGVDQGVWFERERVWTGTDGVVLGVAADGRPELGGATTSDDELFEALTATFVERAVAP